MMLGIPSVGWVIQLRNSAGGIGRKYAWCLCLDLDCKWSFATCVSSSPVRCEWKTCVIMFRPRFTIVAQILIGLAQPTLSFEILILEHFQFDGEGAHGCPYILGRPPRKILTTFCDSQPPKNNWMRSTASTTLNSQNSESRLGQRWYLQILVLGGVGER